MPELLALRRRLLENFPAPEKLEDTAEFLKLALEARHPGMAFDRGALADLVLGPSVLGVRLAEELVELFLRWTRIGQVTADIPGEFLDYLLENFRLSRTAGARAAGTVELVFSTAALVTIPAGSRFRTGELVFEAVQNYATKLSPESVQFPGDRVLEPIGNTGRYRVRIEVQASQPGSRYNIPVGTALVAELPIPFLESAYAYNQFDGGRDSESTAELLERVRSGFSSQAMSNRATMDALLRRLWPQVVKHSIVGFGDAELLRDKHSLLPIATGGRVDWYIQTRLAPQVRRITRMPATLVGRSASGAVWQLSFDREAAAGMYDVVSVRRSSDSDPAAGSLEVISDVRRRDLSPLLGDLLPDIATDMEAVYTRFQTATVRFLDPATPASVPLESVDYYDVSVRYMPDIAAIQETLGSRSYRPAGGDVLIKAPVPCFVSLSFTLYLRVSDTVPDLVRLRQYVADQVNRHPLGGYLDGSRIVEWIYDVVPRSIVVGDLDLVGRILAPSGTPILIRSHQLLEIPHRTEEMVSPRTVMFFLDPADIAVSLRGRVSYD